VTTISNADWFRLIKTAPDSPARLGELITPHGTIPTPVFNAGSSQATVKAVTPQNLRDIGLEMILSNTYHLYLRPESISSPKWADCTVSWTGEGDLDDSGGFQIFSLARLREINDQGVKFRSHIDGSEHFITPEMDIQFQEALGADLIMALDVCPVFSRQTGRG